jgi:hypothetical protein
LRYLKDSIRHSAGYIKRLIETDRKELVAEAILQLVKDIYCLKHGEEPKFSIDTAVSRTCINLDRTEIEFLCDIETASRKRDKYINLVACLNSDTAKSIIDKINRTL